MITLKLKYRLKDEQDMSLILDYQRQYSSCLHFLYNRISDNPSITEKALRLLYNNINNCSLINKWLFQCSIKEAKQIYNSHGVKVIFGGKANYFKRNKLSITKEDYKAKQLTEMNRTAALIQKKESEQRNKEMELTRAEAERARAIADKAYMESMNLSADQFIQLKYIEMVTNKDGANIDVMIGPATSMWNVRR